MNPQGVWGDVIKRGDEYVHVTSPDLVLEFLRITDDPRVRRRLGPERRRTHTQRAMAIVSRAEVVPPASVAGVSRDADDDELFACAIAGAADCIVSEDADVLTIGSYEGVRTVGAAEFLRSLGAARQ